MSSTDALTTQPGLQRIAARLAAGPSTVAYMGSSVTVQRHGYRPGLHQALEQMTGHRHTMVNAGVGAVGAITGLYLMDSLVLPHRPDICFIEFATADVIGWTPPARLDPVLDAIVQRLLSIGCEPCFVYLHRPAADPAAFERMRDSYRRVASHHQISQIDVAAHFERGLQSGELIHEQLFTDAVHNTAMGSALVVELIMSTLGEIDAATSVAARAQDHAPCPYEPSLRAARLLPATPEHLAQPDLGSTGTLRFFYPYVRVQPGNRVDFYVEDELLGIVVVIGPTSGVIRVASAAGTWERDLRDVWSANYERVGSVIFDEPLAPSQRITLEPTEAGMDLRLIGWMVRPC